MSIIEKKDVKNHLSLRHSRDIYLCEPMSPPDATGYSLAEPDAISANPSAFAKDYSGDHTLSAIQVTPAANLIGSTEPQAHKTPKSTQQ